MSVEYWITAIGSLIILIVAGILLNKKYIQDYKEVCLPSVPSDVMPIRRMESSKVCQYIQEIPYSIERETALSQNMAVEGIKKGGLDKLSESDKENIRKKTNDYYDGKVRRNDLVYFFLIIGGVIGSILLIVLGSKGSSGYDNYIFGSIPLIFILLMFIYLRYGSKNYAKVYGSLRDPKNPRTDIIIGGDLVFRSKLQHGFGYGFLIIGCTLLIIYIILSINVGIWNLLIIPIMLMGIGLLLRVYHDDGAEKPPILDEEDSARKSSATYYLLILGSVLLSITIIILLLLQNTTISSISSLGTGIISTILLTALIRRKNKKPVSMDNCIDIGFDSAECMPMKETYCAENPDADICKL